eukprot:g1574.t1
MTFAAILKGIGIDSEADAQRVLAKAKELVRISMLKMPRMGLAEVARYAVCVDCACRILNCTPSDMKKIQRFSGVDKKMYRQTLVRMQNILQVRTTASLSLRGLALKFGCTFLVGFTDTVLQLYKTRFREHLHAGRRHDADFSSPKFMAAAFYLSAKKKKVKVDRRRLLELLAVQGGEFNHVVNDMRALCFDKVGTGSKEAALKSVSEERRKEILARAAQTCSSKRIPLGNSSHNSASWRNAAVARLRNGHKGKRKRGMATAPGANATAKKGRTSTSSSAVRQLMKCSTNPPPALLNKSEMDELEALFDA